MAFIFDIIIVVIAVLCIVICRKHGLVRSVIETTGGLVAAFIAYILAKPMGVWLSDNLIKGLFAESTAEALISIEGTTVSGSAVDALSEVNVSQVVNDAPQAFTDMLSAFNVDIAEVQKAAASTGASAKEQGEAILDAIITPVSQSIAMCICFLVVFVILMIVISLLAKFASGISYIPIVGGFNKFFGALFGVLKAVAFVCVFTAMINLVMPYIAEPLGIDKEDPYKNTLICKTVCEINPLIKLLPEP